MKVILITLVGLSTALSSVHGSAAAAGPAKPQPTGLTPQQAQALVMQLASPFVNLPGLGLQAAADLGIAQATSLVEQHLADNADAEVDADTDAEEEDEVTAAGGGEGAKKTGFSAKDVKRLQAASAAAKANEMPLLTLQDGMDCSDVCIKNQGELPASMVADPAETDADIEEDDPAAPASGTPGGAGDTDEDGAEEEEDDAEDDTEGDEEEGATAADQDEDDASSPSSGIINRLWKKAKRAVAPATAPAAAAAKKAPTKTPIETNENENDDDNDDDNESQDTDSTPAPNANPKPATGAAQDNFAAPSAPAAGTAQKKVLSESELHAKVASCVKTCLLNRAKEITPEDLDERRAKMEALLRKQEL
ncbi:hypothetical protein BGZ95_002224 [Linnemannia exigua]|uniref:Uncharacterized protein n=1 Tax=Linnemannia exigua TaxID=604196 RepID=A0AAD4D7Y6_9FUNG|nr:hypothetical protein BGZ95_002224 [Linnemannia exigua]